MAIDLDSEFGSPSGTTASVDRQKKVQELYIADRDAFNAYLEAGVSLDLMQHKLEVSRHVLPVLESDASIRTSRIANLQVQVEVAQKDYEAKKAEFQKAKLALEAEVGHFGGSNTVRQAANRLGGWLKSS